MTEVAGESHRPPRSERCRRPFVLRRRYNSSPCTWYSLPYFDRVRFSAGATRTTRLRGKRRTISTRHEHRRRRTLHGWTTAPRSFAHHWKLRHSAATRPPTKRTQVADVSALRGQSD